MAITIESDLEEKARARADAEGLTVEAYLERLITEDEWEELAGNALGEGDPDFESTRSAVLEGLAEAEQGRGSPAVEVFHRLRERHGIRH